MARWIYIFDSRETDMTYVRVVNLVSCDPVDAEI
jgi:hypothetical protein